MNWSYNGESWTGVDVGNLNNGDRTPVVFNIASSCGNITNSDCLSEIWLEKYPGGAVASWAASDPTYTIPNTGLDRALFWTLCDTLSHGTSYQPPIWDIGWIAVFADFYMVAMGGAGATTNYKMYLWLGDPALEPWRGQPINPTVDYPAGIPPGPQNFTITVNNESNQPIEGALVCVYKDPEVYEYGYTDVSGEVTFYINPDYGTMLVTASSCNILPFEGTCMVVPGVAEEEERRVANLRLRSNIVKDKIVLYYSLPRGEEWEVTLYDVSGREVLCQKFRSDGFGEVVVDIKTFSSGIYFVLLQDGHSRSKHPVLVIR
ncbi:MAG TPA: T9SS type A sorting domain-containing protein, partial [bacterium (Candidatus Stahlbacteria)]|nr:T9SS type A sorting domain-containing protein [Candidatus Stahlbacteria bacterium]